MEQNEKNGTVPEWVEVVQDFPLVVQQSLGNLCSTIIQQLATVALISYPLFKGVVKEVMKTCQVSIDAELFVQEIVKDALKND